MDHTTLSTVEELLKAIKACGEELTRRQIWHRYLSSVDRGLCLEFGVFKGTSINYMAEARPDAIFHGFDSFEGLPEDWRADRRAGHFTLNSIIPVVRSNVTLHRGWFEKTLPIFISQPPPITPLQAVHIDCDLGSSTTTVLNELTHWLLRDKPVLLFDEFIGYHGFQDHEIKAFCDWSNAHQVKFKVLGRGNEQVLLQLL